MSDVASTWAATQLAEFVVRLSQLEHPDAVARDAVDGIAEALDCEVAALVLEGRVVAAIGWPFGREPEQPILTAAKDPDADATVEVPGAGDVPAVVAPVDRRGGAVLVARVDDPLTSVERALLSAMGRSTRMAVDAARLFQSEREAREAAQQLAEQRRRLLDDMVMVNQAKDDFISVTSHELRTPLTSIIGFVETLRHQPDLGPEQRDRALEVVERQARRLRSLVSDLLDVSTIEAGGTRAHPLTLAVAPVLRDLVAERLTRHPEDLVVHVREDLRVRVDPGHLRRVLVNLVTNAVKYGRPPIRVETRLVGEFVEICVRDHGDGVPEEFRPHLFDKFTQASRGLSRSASGAGLGLAIALGLAEANGGSLRFEEPDGPGARFVLAVPVASDDVRD